jgi:hypothetical protein
MNNTPNDVSPMPIFCVSSVIFRNSICVNLCSFKLPSRTFTLRALARSPRTRASIRRGQRR